MASRHTSVQQPRTQRKQQQPVTAPPLGGRTRCSPHAPQHATPATPPHKN
nr:unnamed protein product [Digitaria exilis]